MDIDHDGARCADEPSVSPMGGTVVLANGVELPRLGLGVFRIGPGGAARIAVLDALRAGYRHIDTAAIYRNEVEVGRAVRQWCDETGHVRADVFITTKLWNEDQGYDRALHAFDSSEASLGLGVIDLFLLHWPVPGKRNDSWRALERVFAEGRCRAIGVSNFTIKHLDELLAGAQVVPHVNQIELHPFLVQTALVERCRVEKIQTAAYSPLTKGRMLGDPVVQAVAKELGATAAQVMIAWGLAHGHVVLPKTTDPRRMAGNLAATRVALGGTRLARLDKLDRGLRTAWDPSQVE